MSYKNIAFLAAVCATSFNGVQTPVGRAPQNPPNNSYETSQPSGPGLTLVCPVGLSCDDLPSALKVKKPLFTSFVILELTIGGQTHDQTVPRSSSSDVTFNVDCEGQSLQVTVSLVNAPAWSHVTTCEHLEVN